MIGAIKTVGVYVEDPEAALSFYIDKLGFELRRKESLASTGQYWIEVSPKHSETSLVIYAKSMMKDWEKHRASIVFHCADVQATCKQLEKSGVAITMQPTEMEFGMFAAFEDLDGNQFGMTSQLLA